MIKDAKSVEVWKTRGNTIRTLDVLENMSSKKRKHRRYSHLRNHDTDSFKYSDYNSDHSRMESKLDRHEDRHHDRHNGMRVINVSESLDGVIILRKQDQSHNSRVTLLEELNPRRLVLEDLRKETETSSDERRLSYSRHYSATGPRSHHRDVGSPANRNIA